MSCLRGFSRPLLLLLCISGSRSWVQQLPSRRTTDARKLPVLFQSDSKASTLQEEGERLIRKALLQEGCADDQVDIAWKAGRVVVTISGTTFLQDESAQDEEEEGDDKTENSEAKPTGGVNLVELTRSIQGALDMNDEGSIGWQLGMNYEFEVTTPGASNELSGIMFESYKGFDVMVDFVDPKTKKNKSIDGRLVERNDEFTVINVKGRMKKIRNDMVQSVKLPKAKKEKGVR